ncbi:hypothetical protein [Bacteroides sedimenti]|uniref:SH3 domain-containing protein n=1 Tax=Bacteroides sedimenti TaxID=2136147 RepID=A0ABM8IHN2_9BACE
MKKLFLFIIYLLLIGNLSGQIAQKQKVVLLNFRSNKIVNIYNSWTKEKIIAKIEDDSIAENYYWFDFKSKKDSMINVIASSTNNNKKQIRGWVKITDTGIYLRPRNTIYIIYEKPDRKSNNVKITLYGSFLVKVLDISNSWLKIEVFHKNILYRYWLPYEYQCCDIYDSCT